MLVMIRESRSVCCCSCGLSCQQISSFHVVAQDLPLYLIELVDQPEALVLTVADVEHLTSPTSSTQNAMHILANAVVRRLDTLRLRLKTVDIVDEGRNSVENMLG